MDESAFPGCVVRARIIGFIEAEQGQDGQKVRNDRIVAVAKKAHDYGDSRMAERVTHLMLRFAARCVYF
jgi:inorganic pyrophosphatase